MPISHKTRSLVSSLLLALSACFAATTAQATVLAFEGVVADTAFDDTFAPYAESGYVFSNNKEAGSSASGISGKNWRVKSIDTGSAVFGFCAHDANCAGKGVVITLTGPTPFSLTSIGVGKFFDDVYGAGKLDLIGRLVGGGTVTRTLIADKSYNVFTLTGFDGLTSLDLIGREVFAIGIDNLVVNSTQQVPEPGTLSLGLAAALGVLASLRKRKLA